MEVDLRIFYKVLVPLLKLNLSLVLERHAHGEKKIEAHLGIVGASIRRDSDLRATHHQTRSNKFKIQ